MKFASAKKLKMVPLALATFCLVSGGPHGLEPVLGESGITLGLLMIVVIPIIWALPVALMTAELSAAIPEEGGFYVWVRRALGPFPGFMCAWLSWLYSIVDAALYPLLFAKYLSEYISMVQGHPISNLTQVVVVLFVVILVTGVNLRGIQAVGKAATYLTAIIVIPFLLMVVKAGISVPHLEPIKLSWGALSVGLAAALWNYLGWDNLSTVAAEVENPQKSFPRSLAISIPMVTFVYLLPVLAALRTSPNADQWFDGGWAGIATRASAPWIGTLVLLAALAATSAMFASQMLASSRLPAVLAEDGYLPRSLAAIHPKWQTPARSILLCAFCYTCLSWFSFTELITANVILYGLSILFEFAALVVLRVREPNLERPYRVPGGLPVVALLGVLPALLILVVSYSSVQDEGWLKQIPTAMAIGLGVGVYAFARRRTVVASVAQREGSA
ncbi:MAG: APC family permease [Armatimonadetes bacterium]|nr:APC family permease [Armatimonadota bacterium]